MFLVTVIKKTVTGIMQSAGGFAEPISRALGIRVRTAAGSAVEVSHDDTAGTVNCSVGALRLNSATTIDLNKPLNVAGEILSDGKHVSITGGTTAERPSTKCPQFHIHIDTDLQSPTYTDDGGTTWYTFGGSDVT